HLKVGSVDSYRFYYSLITIIHPSLKPNNQNHPTTSSSNQSKTNINPSSLSTSTSCLNSSFKTNINTIHRILHQSHPSNSSTIPPNSNHQVHQQFQRQFHH
ncbi:hypothetical protein LINPERHAP1_LOCUS9048, partial [Linum perenne]